MDGWLPGCLAAWLADKMISTNCLEYDGQTNAVCWLACLPQRLPDGNGQDSLDVDQDVVFFTGG